MYQNACAHIVHASYLQDFTGDLIFDYSQECTHSPSKFKNILHLVHMSATHLLGIRDLCDFFFFFFFL